MNGNERTVAAPSGGIGGAKLALGLSRVLPPAELLVVANTGDDFEHHRAGGRRGADRRRTGHQGATAKMMIELGVPVSVAAVAERYADIIDGYIVDHAVAGTSVAFPVTVTHTVMRTLKDREALARAALAAADALANTKQ